MEHSKKKYQQYFDNDENIDLVALTKTLWEARKEIVKITLIFIGVGVLLAITLPSKYTSTIVVKPTLSDSNSKLDGSIGGLAAMAGINLGAGNSLAEINPNLYPKIIASYGFQKELMESPIYVKILNSAVSYEEYYTQIHRLSLFESIKKYTIDFPSFILKYFKSKKDTVTLNNNFQIISETDKKMIEKLNSQLHININEKLGIVELSATMPERLQAAQMVLSAQNILQRKVINHKLKKAEEDLNFIEERFNEKKSAFELAQNNLAKYRDANKNVNTATAKTEAERLESEYQLAFSVYSELAKQVEAQKIQVKENTPVFAVIQDAVVPLNRSNMPKGVLVIICAFFGAFFGVTLAYLKTYLKDIKKRWAE